MRAKELVPANRVACLPSTGPIGSLLPWRIVCSLSNGSRSGPCPGDAPIGLHHLPDDRARPESGQEGYGAGDVLRAGETAHRNQVPVAVADLVERDARVGGVDVQLLG